ncbi:fatty acid desaturase [Leptospira ryugenii]|uniref:Fatty acid desaturase n=2 Tax=Leptospira ryugenii TaxID=1917863 RepID=A0A2P2DYK8_9LEPT|nr:fatty acid desaturase [Leptospira ryugenii]
MSYYTYLHHTTTDIDIYEPEAWNPYLGQIVSTYNVVHPKWLSFLHFHIDIHTPHHLSTAIPSYHLPAAWDALKQSEYSKDLKEGRVSLRFYLHQILHCHLWDVEANVYRSFGEVD